MQHIQGQDFVGERLKTAKSQKAKSKKLPFVGLQRLILGVVMAGFVAFSISVITGAFGVVISILLVMLFDYDPTNMILGAIIIIGVGIIGFFVFYFGIMSFMVARILGINAQKESDIGILEAGVEGEAAVVSQLSKLNDKWFLFSGVVVDGIWGDIDQVLIGPSGIFAIESKHWVGEISFDGSKNTWHRYTRRKPEGEILSDPAGQIYKNTQVLERVLGESIFAVVVFTHPNSRYDGDPHPQASVLTIGQLMPWVENLPALYHDVDIQNLVNRLNLLLKR